MGNLKGVKEPFRLKPSKRMSIILGVVVTVLLLTVLAWISAAAAWQANADAVDLEQKSALKTLKTAIEATDKNDRLGAVVRLANTKYSSERCKGAWWVVWQRNVSEPSKVAEKRCMAANSSLGAINRASIGLKKYLDDEKVIEAQISMLKIDPKQKDWQTHANASATETYDALKKLKASDASKPVLLEATKRVEGIVTGWKSLIDANKKQDKNAYTLATTNLSDSYAGLGAISDASDVQITRLVTALKSTM